MRCAIKLSGHVLVSGDDFKPNVMLKDCILRAYGEYGIEINNATARIDGVYFIMDKPRFLDDPLMWIALTILDHRYKRRLK